MLVVAVLAGGAAAWIADGPRAMSREETPSQGRHGGQQSNPQTRPSEDRPRNADPTDDATAHHPFDETSKWVGIFDDPSRDEWQMPAEVVKALKLASGMNVADIGAGTGYFNRRLAGAVGPEGKVYAVDTEPKMIEYMTDRAAKEKTPNVLPVLAAPDDPKLPEAGVDVVLICDTYHHINDRLDYFQRIKKTLRSGGRIAIVDFHKRPLPVGPPPEHKLPREHVVAEFEKAGYRLQEEPTFLPYQYFLIFAPL